MKVPLSGDDEAGRLFANLGADRNFRPGMVWPMPIIVEIAIGAENFFALDIAGRVWVWGGPACRGGARSGRQFHPAAPQCVASLPRIQRIVANPLSTVVYAIDIEGELWGWGISQHSELGDSNGRFVGEPKLLGVHDVAGLAAGATFALAVTQDGRLIFLGERLGEETSRAAIDLAISGLAREPFSRVWCGADCAIVRTVGGKTFASPGFYLFSSRYGGAGIFRRLPVLDRYEDFVLGDSHGFGIDESGSISEIFVSGSCNDSLFSTRSHSRVTADNVRPIAAANWHTFGLKRVDHSFIGHDHVGFQTAP
ncbi:hypothetical protein AACH06_20435 [Ideonella sp. DXS29W]|uniref:Uncharacterized protein n=1 Tax=Ideonella lacteola TaxID=2984193 RepID=A0ABU9BVM8_9BURK